MKNDEDLCADTFSTTKGQWWIYIKYKAIGNHRIVHNYGTFVSVLTQIWSRQLRPDFCFIFNRLFCKKN